MASNIIKQSFSCVIVFFLSFGVVEVSLRVLDPIGIEYFFEVSKYFDSMQSNRIYSYIHHPGSKTKLQGVEVAINSHGLRGSEFKKVKPFGKKRILILGDSMVFGWGAPQKDIFAVEMQRLFNHSAPEVEVIPAGVGSWNTRTEYEYLKSTAIDFKPDVLVLLIVENDIYPKKLGNTEVSKAILFPERNTEDSAERKIKRKVKRVWREFVGYSYLLKYVQYFTKVRRIRKSQAEVVESSPKWEDARLALKGIVEICRDNDVDIFIYLYSSKPRLIRNTNIKLYYDYLKSIGAHPYLLPESLFKQTKYRNSRVDKHPNDNGHMIIAQEMYQQLLPGIAGK